MRISNTIEAGGSALREEWTPDAKPRWLSLGLDGAERVRLPDATSLDYLEAQIKAAIRSDDCLVVELYHDPTLSQRRMILNGAALPYVVLMEEADTFSL